MSGFQFPPPPPPPPSGPPSQGQPPFDCSTQVGRGEGRGRGRGRGRGGGFNRGNHRGGSNNNISRHGGQSTAMHQPGSYIAHQHLLQPQTQTQTDHGPNYSNHGGPTQPQSYVQAPVYPPGAFINPSFQQPQAPQVTGGQFTGYTQPSFPLFPQRQIPPVQPSGQPEPSSRSAAGHKRKLDALKGPHQNGKKPAPPTAPSIPGFGHATLPAKPPPPLRVSERGGYKKQTQPKALGLTPSYAEAGLPVPDSDDDDDDENVDEEAMHAELGTTLTFEHNGILRTLSSLADLAAWKGERKENFPTRNRIAAKLEEKRQFGEERLRLLNIAYSTITAARDTNAWRRREKLAQGNGSLSSKENTRLGKDKAPRPPETKFEKTKRQLVEQTKRVELLRKQVAETQAGIEKARTSSSTEKTPHSFSEDIRENVDSTTELSLAIFPSTSERPDRGLANDHLMVLNTSTEQSSSDKPEPNDTIHQPPEVGVPVKQAIIGKPSSALHDGHPEYMEDTSKESEVSSVVSSDTSMEEESVTDDGPPEEATSKAPAASVNSNPKLCRYFAASGYCRDGDSCRFQHELAPGVIPSSHGSGNAQTIHSQRPRHLKQKLLDGLAGKKSIYGRLVEQEQKDQNRLALQVIKHLGALGFFSEETCTSTLNEEVSEL